MHVWSFQHVSSRFSGVASPCLWGKLRDLSSRKAPRRGDDAIMRDRRHTSWHSHVPDKASKVVLYDRYNSSASFSEDDVHFSVAGAAFQDLHHHFAWQAQPLVKIRRVWNVILRGRRRIWHTLPSTVHTLHATLYTLHVRLYTSRFALSTLDFALDTLHFRPRTVPPHLELYTPHSHFTLETPHFTLYTPYFTLRILHFTLHTLHFTSHLALHTLRALPCTLHTLDFTLYTWSLKLYTSHFHTSLYIFHLQV